MVVHFGVVFVDCSGLAEDGKDAVYLVDIFYSWEVDDGMGWRFVFLFCKKVGKVRKNLQD